MLDLTRSISRAGRVPTGVDRVELSYLKHLLHLSEPVFGLVRSTLGYVLVDRSGLQHLSKRLQGQEKWGARDALSFAARRKGEAVQRAESDLRRFAHARVLPRNVGRMLSSHLPAELQYINVGHSNLNDRTLWAVRHALQAKMSILLHDTIPLDFPQYQRPGTPEQFRRKLSLVQRFADQVICNSAYTRDRMHAHMSSHGAIPQTIVAPLGVDLVHPDRSAIPAGVDLTKPYFVSVGTIEPRKNHVLLLDVWEDLIAIRGADATPRLLICGSRGWNNEAVFRRLDALPKDGPILELDGLCDGAVSALVKGAQAMIFPSEAEGYGLPPIEAACLGTPVICRDLPVYRETLNDIPVYLQAPDRYLLTNLVQSLLNGPEAEQEIRSAQPLAAPTWTDHFSLVFGER